MVTVDKSGATQADVAALAELVRFTPPRDLLAPFSFTYLPPGVGLQHAFTRTAPDEDTDAMVFLGRPPAPEPVTDPYWSFQSAFPLSVRAIARSDYVDSHAADLGPATKLAGLDTWELTGPRNGWIVPTGARLLVIQTATCQVSILARDARQFSSDHLNRMVEGATFGSCVDRGTWVRPIQ